MREFLVRYQGVCGQYHQTIVTAGNERDAKLQLEDIAYLGTAPTVIDSRELPPKEEISPWIEWPYPGKPF